MAVSTIDADGLAPGATATTLNGLTDCTVSASDPAADSNPSSGVGHLWVNSTSGEQYILTDATAGSNVWTNVGDGSGTVPAAPLSATGGTITTSGGYKIHTFTSSGTFTVSSLSTLSSKNLLEYLVVAGGGAGSTDSIQGAGGAGGYRSSVVGELSGASSSAETRITAQVQSYTVTIGAGQASRPNGPGSNSVFGSITSLGGGSGGTSYQATPAITNGGSGGGSRGDNQFAISGGSGTSGQGTDGGANVTTGDQNYGGGGGGAKTAGSPSTSSGAGVGGDGISSSITGTAVTRGVGGTPENAGGSQAGPANTGNGGASGSGGIDQGGSGIVIIRYLT